MTALSERLNRLRAALLGANDGIVSVAGVLTGIAAARPGAILAAAVAAIIAGALSMAAGEYVSVAAQRDAEKANQTPVTVNPMSAALSSAMSFTAGAAVPALAMLLTPEQWRIPVTVVAALTALAAAGAFGAESGGMPWRKSTFRSVAGGGLTMLVAYLVGAWLA